jgi:BED zinc finger
MSSSGSQAIPTSESISSELFRPANSCDPGWKYGRLIDKHDTNTVKCLLCNKITKGGINRFKMHLTGLSGNVVKCGKADEEVKNEIEEYLDVIKKKKEDKKRELHKR